MGRRAAQALAAVLALGLGAAAASPAQIHRLQAPPAAARPLAMAVGGRALRDDAGAAAGYVRQWPGTYFESAFRGRSVAFAVGPGEVALRVLVDGAAAGRLVRPAPGLYALSGLAAGRHTARVEVVSESQHGPTRFGGFFATGATRGLPPPKRRRQMEFIGDSHTVGYGDRATTRHCTRDEVWATTDTSRAFGPRVARRYAADYQVNAISGRGVVRNYDGQAGDTLPAAYPFVLFDRQTPYRDPGWRPQLIVIGLGTNDFSTPLHADEPWRSREALRADYEAAYLRFVRMLRARDPGAFFLLLATDGGAGELTAEVARVTAQLHAAGEQRVDVVAPRRLTFAACDFHPSAADDGLIADALAAVIDAHPGIWDEAGSFAGERGASAQGGVTDAPAGRPPRGRLGQRHARLD